MAKAILTLAAAGAPVPEVLADELARAVLEDTVVSLARNVAEGGQYKLRRAVELAESVIMERTQSVDSDCAMRKQAVH